MHTFQTEDGYTFYLQPYGALTDSKNPENADMTFDTLAAFMTENDSDTVRAFDITLSNGYHFQVTPDYEDDKLHTAIFDAENDHEDTIDAESVEGLTKLINKYAEL